MRRVLFQSRLVDNGRVFEAVDAGLKEYAAGFRQDTNSAELATKVHRCAYEALGVDDPYLELKIRADEVAETYLERAEGFVRVSEDRFKAAVRVSIIGNVMDFGSGIAIDDPDDFGKAFESLLEQGIGYDDSDRVREAVDASSTVIYVFDNCGESQFDKILIRELKRMGKRVVGVTRGKAILNDVTEADALRIGLDSELDRILTTGGFSIGMDMRMIGSELRKEISGAGIILAKGMANFESLSDEDLGVPIAYLMRAKCVPVADAVGVPVGTNVVRLQV